MDNSEGFKLLRSIADDFANEIYLKSLSEHKKYFKLLNSIRDIQTDIAIGSTLLDFRSAAFMLRVAINRFYVESNPRKRYEYEEKFVKLTNLLV